VRGCTSPALPELMGQLRRCFSTMRLYAAGHDNVRLALDALHASLSAYLEANGPLTMRIHAHGVEVEGRTFFEDERREESIARPIFVDGVESITLHPELPRETLSVYMLAWLDALAQNFEAEHSFATWVYEQDLEHVETVVRAGLGAVDADEDATRIGRSRVAQLWDELMQPNAPPARALQAPELARIAEVLGALDPVALARVAVDEAATRALGPIERRALADAVSAGAEDVGARGLWLVWRRLARASGTEAASARPEPALAARIARELVDGARLGELARGATRIAAQVGVHAVEPDALLAALRPIAPRLVAALETRRADVDALAALAALPLSALVDVGPSWAALGAEPRARLGALLAEKAPPPELWADWLLGAPPSLAGLVLDLAEAHGAEAFEACLRIALVHEAPEVAARALTRIPPALVDALRGSIAPALDEGRPEVRRAALSALIRAHDPEVPNELARQIADARSPLEWRRSCVHGLGLHGGLRAAARLAAIAEGADEEVLRVAALQALGGLDDPDAEQALTRAAGRVLGRWTERGVAREQLRRRARRAAGARDTEPPGVRSSLAPGDEPR
jgi:hypothetical protein